VAKKTAADLAVSEERTLVLLLAGAADRALTRLAHGLFSTQEPDVDSTDSDV
jgi:hypothetical protein